MTLTHATHDQRLTATLLAATPLRYCAGGDPALDCPAHVRAGSSLARLGGLLAVVQDDANFVALIDPRSGEARALALPAGAGGRRTFDDLQGNKHLKLDLEACVAVPPDSSDTLLAFGSGSSPLREQVAIITGCSGPAPQVAVRHAPRLYAALRDYQPFAGSELNIEGAAIVDGWLRLANRGNGAPRGALAPVDALCDLPWAAVWSYLQAPEHSAPPPPQNVRQYALGQLGGLRLTFTDIAIAPGGLLFSSAAEASPDVTRDGPVVGAALGVLDAGGTARWAPLRALDGALFTGKVEGVLLADDLSHAQIIIDRDDPVTPSELCLVALGGPWFE